VIDSKTGAHSAGVNDPDRGSVGGVDPRDNDWNKVSGECTKTNRYSVAAKYTENVDISGLTPSQKSDLKAGKKQLRGDLQVTITAKCGRNPAVTKTVHLVVDGRMDANTDADADNEIVGGFDDSASDYDGDNRNPDPNPFDPAR
jgi:hypothetical protein